MYKNCSILLLFIISGCATNKSEQVTFSGDYNSEKITITGTKISKSDLPSGPKLVFKPNKNKDSYGFFEKLSGMEKLPQPKDIGDCKGLLKALPNYQVIVKSIGKNTVLLENEYGEYEYVFDDDSCPTKGII